MAEIQFERRGTPLWKVVLGLLLAGAAAFGGYELLDRDDAPGQTPATAPATAPAAPTTPPAGEATRPQPPAGATPSPRPTTTQTP